MPIQVLYAQVHMPQEFSQSDCVCNAALSYHSWQKSEMVDLEYASIRKHLSSL